MSKNNTNKHAMLRQLRRQQREQETMAEFIEKNNIKNPRPEHLTKEYTMDEALALVKTFVQRDKI